MARKKKNIIEEDQKIEDIKEDIQLKETKNKKEVKRIKVMTLWGYIEKEI